MSNLETTEPSSFFRYCMTYASAGCANANYHGRMISYTDGYKSIYSCAVFSDTFPPVERVPTNYSLLPTVLVEGIETLDPWEETWFMPALYVIWGIAGLVLLIGLVMCGIRKTEKN